MSDKNDQKIKGILEKYKKLEEIKNQYIWNFLNYKSATRGSSENTTKMYGCNLLQFEKFLLNKNKDLLEIKFEDVDEWIGSFGKESTKSQKLATLKSFYKFLSKRNIVEKNILEGYDTIKIGISDISDDDMLEPEEVQQLINETKKNKNGFTYETLIRIFIGTGARLNEILNLNINDLVIEEGRTKKLKRKWNIVSIIPFSDDAEEALQQYIKKNSKEIKKRNGKLFDIPPTTFRYRLNKLAKVLKSKKKVHPHLFRHMWTTQKIREKKDPMLIQEYGGWAPGSPMLKRYSHLSEKEKLKNFRRKSAKFHT